MPVVDVVMVETIHFIQDRIGGGGGGGRTGFITTFALKEYYCPVK